jgi:protein-S-isoprenylcysteine O-methyltransferase Ste14
MTDEETRAVGRLLVAEWSQRLKAFRRYWHAESLDGLFTAVFMFACGLSLGWNYSGAPEWLRLSTAALMVVLFIAGMWSWWRTHKRFNEAVDALRPEVFKDSEKHLVDAIREALSNG